MNRSARLAALAIVDTLVAAGCNERGPVAPTRRAPNAAQSTPVAANGELINGVVYHTASEP